MLGSDVTGGGSAGRGQDIACGKSGWLFVGEEGARTFAGTGGRGRNGMGGRGALPREGVGTLEDTEFDGAIGMN